MRESSFGVEKRSRGGREWMDMALVGTRDCTGRAGLWAPGPISVVRTRASRIPGSLGYGLLRLFGLFGLFGLGA